MPLSTPTPAVSTSVLAALYALAGRIPCAAQG